ncbi:hypothetical protein MSAN_00029200 [Mycena sanguinolenta]|uniref:Inhibitor I9 domain-containing protein n=1 Tax=Mycena sanguinolenta TaxID=230812 RepID=A0A8H6ZBR9_9AGAR|nr:hypothetical protein MSAN_00029200 [Mycena sanguinolenta]
MRALRNSLFNGTSLPSYRHYHTTMTAGKYIVLFKPDATDDQVAMFFNSDASFTSLKSEGKIKHTYDMPGYKGFAAELSSEQLDDFQSLKNKGGIIDSIEADGVVTTQ